MIVSASNSRIVPNAAFDAEEHQHMHMATKSAHWTIAELDRLPEDGNKYELVRGELFVTPAPRPGHEEIAVVLRGLLEPYVKTHKLGRIYTPRSVVQVPPDSEVEPDLMVRPFAPKTTTWDRAPRPILVVEITSDTTR